MTESVPLIARETITPKTRRPLRTLLLLAAAVLVGLLFLSMIAVLITDMYFEEHRYDRMHVGDLGMIRAPNLWNDPDVVTYRSWEADTVIVAVPAPFDTAENDWGVGAKCFVHGSTLVRIEAWYRWDVLLKIVGRADPRDKPDLADDCPEGSMFVAGQEQALRMLGNEQVREFWQRSDSVLTHGRLLPAWDAPRARLIRIGPP